MLNGYCYKNGSYEVDCSVKHIWGADWEVNEAKVSFYQNWIPIVHLNFSNISPEMHYYFRNKFLNANEAEIQTMLMAIIQ